MLEESCSFGPPQAPKSELQPNVRSYVLIIRRAKNDILVCVVPLMLTQIGISIGVLARVM